MQPLEFAVALERVVGDFEGLERLPGQPLLADGRERVVSQIDAVNAWQTAEDAVRDIEKQFIGRNRDDLKVRVSSECARLDLPQILAVRDVDFAQRQQTEKRSLADGLELVLPDFQ